MTSSARIRYRADVPCPSFARCLAAIQSHQSAGVLPNWVPIAGRGDVGRVREGGERERGRFVPVVGGVAEVEGVVIGALIQCSKTCTKGLPVRTKPKTQRASAGVRL